VFETHNLNALLDCKGEVIKSLWRHIQRGPKQRDETWRKGKGVIFPQNCVTSFMDDLYSV